MAEKANVVKPRLKADSVHTDPKSRLKKQPTDSRRPWQPGEVPAGPLITISRPHDDKPYGSDWMAAEPPKREGDVVRNLSVNPNLRYPKKSTP